MQKCISDLITCFDISLAYSSDPGVISKFIL